MSRSRRWSDGLPSLYMEFFEKLAVETAPTRPRLWKRYVDDTFCILRKDSAEELLCHLNGVRPTIKVHAL